jgi:hypothetical protein
VTAGSETARGDALDAFLTQSAAKGFRIETRTRTQAVIVRRSGALFFMRWLPRNTVGQQRQVVSVDEHGVVSTVSAEPVRW